jgi:hypothetical protein
MNTDASRFWTRAIQSAETAGPATLEACLIRVHTAMQNNLQAHIPLIAAVRNGLSASSHAISRLVKDESHATGTLTAVHVALHLVNASLSSSTAYATASIAVATGLIQSHTPHIHSDHVLLSDLTSLRAASLQLLSTLARRQNLLQQQATVITPPDPRDICCGFCGSALLTNVLAAGPPDDAISIVPYLTAAVDAHLHGLQSLDCGLRTPTAPAEVDTASIPALLLAIDQASSASDLEFIMRNLTCTCLRLASTSGPEPAPPAQLYGIVSLVTRILDAAGQNFAVLKGSLPQRLPPPMSRLQVLFSQCRRISPELQTLPLPPIPLQNLAAASLVATGLVHSQEGQCVCPGLGPFLMQALSLLQHCPNSAQVLLELVPSPDTSSMTSSAISSSLIPTNQSPHVFTKLQGSASPDAGPESMSSLQEHASEVRRPDVAAEIVMMPAPTLVRQAVHATGEMCTGARLQCGTEAMAIAADCGVLGGGAAAKQGMKNGVIRKGEFSSNSQSYALCQDRVNGRLACMAVNGGHVGPGQQPPACDALSILPMRVCVHAGWPGLQHGCEHVPKLHDMSVQTSGHQLLQSASFPLQNGQQSIAVCLSMPRSRWLSLATFMATLCAACLTPSVSRRWTEQSDMERHRRCIRAANSIALQLCCADTVDARNAASALLSALIVSCPCVGDKEQVNLLVLQCTQQMLSACPDVVPPEEMQQVVAMAAAAPLGPPTILAICGAAARKCQQLLRQGFQEESVAGVLAMLMVALVHGPAEMLGDVLQLVETVWGEAHTSGTASAVAREVFRHLAHCHDHRKKPQCVRWYHQQLLRFSSQHALSL